MPVLVRLVSHKVSRRQYEAVVLAQVLEGSAGVVWVVAVSRDGAFMATAGQDCVLRVWQLTASRCGKLLLCCVRSNKQQQLMLCLWLCDGCQPTCTCAVTQKAVHLKTHCS